MDEQTLERTDFHPDEVTFEVLEGDPYALFERMRTQAPVLYAPQTDLWLVTGWDACSSIGAMHDSHTAGSEDDDRFFGVPNVLSMSGTSHRELRAGIDNQLRPRSVRSYGEELSRPIVIEYIERIRQQGRANLTAELFEKISVRVIGDKLGLGEIDDETLVDWFKTLSAGLEHLNRENEEATNAAASTADEIDTYLRGLVERLTREPDSSIISHMIHTGTHDGEPRTFEEIVATIRVIILGGFQEPGNAVANTFHGLLSRPDQLARLAAEPERLAAPALEEGLRWIAPINSVERTATKDIVTEWGTIPAGTPFILVVGAANRDHGRFERAEEYDFDRTFLPNATFGYGEHFCAGHALARSLGEIMVEETVRRLPNLRRDPDAQAEVSGFFFRGTKQLPVLWDVVPAES
ncbi:MAG: cytochrome P450 [Leucobacter sp.]|nr:cytochrome P450 [Leucobacter sp.]